MQMAFGATMEVLTSKEFKVSGAIGPVTSLHRKGTNVSDIEVGRGGTNAWSLGGIDPSTTVAIYFDIVNPGTSPLPDGKRRLIQFLTRYQHSNGRTRLRSTTLCGSWYNPPPGDDKRPPPPPHGAGGYNQAPQMQPSPVKMSFDQEAAAVLLARVAVERTDSEEVADVLRWVDRSLIRLCAKFADYTPDDPNSFRLSPELSLFPQFVFLLGRWRDPRRRRPLSSPSSWGSWCARQSLLSGTDLQKSTRSASSLLPRLDRTLCFPSVMRGRTS